MPDAPTVPPPARDHGGGLDAVRARWGGDVDDWLDLSTGINPDPYPLPEMPARVWTALPDAAATRALGDAARAFWGVPDGADILAAPGASALIARLPVLTPPGRVAIPGPTYNEHAAAFRAAGWAIDDVGRDAQVVVHPNNPDGRLTGRDELTAPFAIIDESFCDIVPDATHVGLSMRPGTVVLKSFGKFWGLAGLRLGFAIATPDTLAPLREALGPWPVSGPALGIGTQALRDTGWARRTRSHLAEAARRLDAVMVPHARPIGGTDLFKLYDTADARAFQERLARHRIWSRTFPYSDRWIRLGLPPDNRWTQLEEALA
ncbi:pyridoxal phosphate-dependent class II aminotransferase [Jannaschia sp. S6380]|uniref:threonine-phosphate decarboxylase n=1 Tax=Jannaschia sp. S6380 TaxID=2926408 RepID=UPI001FF6E2FC|nr:threonine-phosphate decarboxylase [Jannaschia sp. S6380]MCK0169211.1 pyridoxal phosphate-dependent class II aminotransferase [Jannaschia sp. S6380]